MDTSQPITLSESIVRELYEQQGLSAAEIANQLNCKPTWVRHCMMLWGIKMRSRSEAMRLKRAKAPNRLVHIPPEELKCLYEEARLSTAELAVRYGCSEGTIRNHLRRAGVGLAAPGRPVVELSESDLTELYLKQKLSLRQIAKRYECDHTTVKNKLVEYGLRLRPYAESNQLYPRLDFNGSLAIKAYLVGFRLGDLHVTMMGKAGQTVVVDCATTKQEQLDLIRELFEPYGHVYIGNPKSRGDIGITCYLNLSFSFLLLKDDAVPDWVQANPLAQTAFAVGYIDAEGSFYLSQATAHFAVSSYDGNILNWLYRWMVSLDVRCPNPRIVGRQGEIRPSGAVYRKDLWTLAVNRKASLLRLIEVLAPHLKHAKRRRDMLAARENIETRNVRRTSK